MTRLAARRWGDDPSRSPPLADLLGVGGGEESTPPPCSSGQSRAAGGIPLVSSQVEAIGGQRPARVSRDRLVPPRIEITAGFGPAARLELEPTGQAILSSTTAHVLLSVGQRAAVRRSACKRRGTPREHGDGQAERHGVPKLGDSASPQARREGGRDPGRAGAVRGVRSRAPLLRGAIRARGGSRSRAWPSR